MPTEEKKIQPKIKEILIKGEEQGAKKKKVFCETFSYQPENVEEIGLGNLYIAGRIESDSSEPSHILNLLSAILKREYYSRPKRKPLNSLREGLKRANIALADLLKTGNSDWLNKISFICIALANNNLYFTKVGGAKVMLLRDAKMTDLSNRLIPDQEKISPQKAFQSIASGKICLGDQIILTTADVFRHISQKGLEQILERKDMVQLEKTLQETKDISSQGIIIIEAVPEEKSPSRDTETVIISVPQKQNTQFQQANRTNKIINAFKENSKNVASDASLLLKGFILRIKDKTRRTENPAQQEKKMPAEIAPKMAPEIAPIDRHEEERGDEKQPSIQLPVRDEPTPLPQPTPVIFAEKKHPEKIIMKDISDKKEEILRLENAAKSEPKTTSLPAIKPRVVVKKNWSMIAGPIEKFLRLPAKSYALTLQAGPPNTSAWSRKIRQLTHLRGWRSQNDSTQTEIPQNLPILASRRATTPRLSQKYFPHKTAMVVVIFLAILIAAYVSHLQRQKYQRQITLYANNAIQFEEELRNIRKINLVEKPTVFADFNQTRENFFPSFLAISKDNLLSANSRSLALYLKPVEGAENGKFITTNILTDKKWRGAKLLNENTIILLDSEYNFYQYDFANKRASPLSLKLPFDQTNITDFLVYNNNLYILDEKNQQIIKCPDLGQCQPWLKEKTLVSSSASFAADGSIYIFNPQENTLTKYYNGRQNETVRLKVNPRLSAGSKIRTEKRFNNLYLSDPDGQRVIIINKKGETIKQYTSREFINLTDIEISDDESQLFFAANQKIYKININDG
ncbi:MAG: hypothetical protein HY813_01620 [Candidatus Portnoybacteria bacterium]|nr:hypothetical protein [Candidatus Portnoybacteria bacterium]